MAESLSFELKLVDSVTAVAKRQADAVKKIETNADKAQSALGKQFEKVGFAAARAARKQEQAFAASWAKIGMAAERAQRQQEKAFERAVERRADRLKEGSFGSGVGEGFGVGKITKGAFYGAMLAEGVIKLGETIIESAKEAVEIFTDGVKDAFRTAGREQVQRIGEKISLGNGAAGFREDADAMERLSGFTEDKIRALMLPMRNAGLSRGASRQAFATASDIAAGQGRGGDAGAVADVMGQFQTIFTKKGFSKKQLIGLLGDVGDTIPGFYKELGKKMKVSAKQAEKLAAHGAVDPQLIMNMITGAQNKKQGGIAGSGGKQYADSFEARWNKLLDLPEKFYRKFADSPSFDRANEALGKLLENLSPDSPNGQRIMASLNHMFDLITDGIGDPEEMAGSLADKIGDAVGFAGELADDFREWADVLLPSLDTIEDMVMALRTMKAFTSNDTAAQVRVIQDQDKIDKRRTARGIEKKLRADDSSMLQENVDSRLRRAQMYQDATHENGPINMPAVLKAARQDTEEQKDDLRKKAGVTVNVTQHFGGVPDNDTAKRAADQAKQHTVTAFEQANGHVGN